jgi:energy-coupling factor transporter ATP-binding protein EcfA2
MIKTRPGIKISTMTFSDGTVVPMQEGEIVVITGPNNSGKSASLKDIDSFFKDRHLRGRRNVIVEISTETTGTLTDFIDALPRISDKFDSKTKKFHFSHSGIYAANTLRLGFQRNRLPYAVQRTYIHSLSTANRLTMLGGDGRSYYNNDREIGRIVITKLFTNEPLEMSISAVINRAFGMDLLLNRTKIEGASFHLGNRSELPKHEDRLKPEFLSWFESRPQLLHQGDGLKSFAGIALSLLADPRKIALIDEPEAFLHPPQVRQLAEVLAQDVPKDTQLVISTHSSDLIRGILDVAHDRVTVVRLRRIQNKSSVSVLGPNEIKDLWRDPLLRTSDLLSALFHEVAIICEGDSDARFYRAVLDATNDGRREVDFRFFHVGGKDRIPNIVSSLRAVSVPTISIVDLDVLSEAEKFMKLYDSHGGSSSEDMLKWISEINNSVNQRKGDLDEDEVLDQIENLVGRIRNKSTKLRELFRRSRELEKKSSGWRRPKEDGYSGLVDAKSISLYHKVREEAKRVGILIVSNGELEGFCRTIPRQNKAEWLSEVLKRDIASDRDLRDARDFAMELRQLMDTLAAESA